MNGFYKFINNQVVITSFFGWFIAQSIKVIVGIIKEKRFNFKWFVDTGGMPSSHVAGVSALATGIGFKEGFYSSIFIFSIVFCIVVTFDAQGVRRATGQQAEILNAIMDDIYWKKRIQEEKLKELIGHTPIEVLAGLILGVFVACIVKMFF